MDRDWDAPASSGDGRFSSGAAAGLAPFVPRPEGRPLGEGGQAYVLAGHDRHLPREVAWKVARHDDARARDRLRHEAHVLARLEHPGILPVFDLVDDGVDVRMATRYFRGRTLRAEVARGQEPVVQGRLLRHMLAVCQAVGFAHERGIVHRDLKPDNIMIGDLGETFVIDWGFAQSERSPDPVGARVGTPHYMSPEQARGEVVGPQSDVWSLGAMLFEVVVGQPLWRELASGAVSERLERDQRPPLPELPPELGAILAQALAISPEDRYRDARALARDLEAYLDGRRVVAHRYSMLQRARLAWRRHRQLMAVGLGGLTIAAIGLPAAWSLLRAERDETARVETERARAVVAAEIDRARFEHARGRRPEAERAAARVLEHVESPEARGVVAAWSRVTRPTISAGIAGPELPKGCRELELSPDGRHIFCGRGTSFDLHEVDLERGRVVQILAERRTYSSVAMANDGVWFSTEGDPRVERVAIGAGERTGIEACGRMLEMVSADTLLDVGGPCAAVIREGREVVRVMSEEGQAFQCVAADGDMLVTLDQVGRLSIYGRSESRQITTRFVSPTLDWRVATLAGPLERRSLVLGNVRGRLALVDLRDGRVRQAGSFEVAPVRDLYASPEGALLLVRYDHGVTRLISEAGLTTIVQFPTEPLSRSWFTGAGQIVTIGADLEVFAPVQGAVAGFDGLDGVTSASIEGDELIVSHHHHASVFSLRDGALRERFHHPRQVIKTLKNRGPEVLIAVAASEDEQGLVEELPSREPRLVAGVRRAERLANGRFVFAGSGPSVAVETPDGVIEEIARERVVDLVVADDIAATLGRLSPTLRVWDLTGGPVELQSCEVGMSTGIGAARFPEGVSVLLAQADRIEAVDMTCVPSRVWWVPGGTATRVTAAARGPHRYVIAGTRAGEVLVWRWDGELVARVAQHTEAVSSLSVDASGRWLVSGSWDGRVRFLDLDVMAVPARVLVSGVRRGAVAVDW